MVQTKPIEESLNHDLNTQKHQRAQNLVNNLQIQQKYLQEQEDQKKMD